MSKLEIDLPAVINDSFDTKARYRVFYGGRGGGKSWTIARRLLAMGVQKKTFILCAREIQKSIKDSVHRLLAEQIKELGLEDFYQVLNTEIKGANGTLFSFVGLKHNTANIKSYEATDICWVEEADSITKSSFEILTPTIRKPSSEIWFTFNPRLEDDYIYQRFVVEGDSDAVVVKVNYSDNDWFPEVLEQERLAMKERDPDAYLNVWEGQCRQILEGAVYANEMRLTAEEDRITRVPIDQSKPVDFYLDIGWADFTSIWCAQSIGFECRVVKYYQNHLQPIQHYIQFIKGGDWMPGTVFLPHDARAKQLGTGRSIEEIVRASGLTVRIVPRLSIEDGINAARTLFNSCWFDRDKCSDGLSSLRHYRYDVDPDTKKYSHKPLHDEHSHGADAFRYLAISWTAAKTGQAPGRRDHWDKAFTASNEESWKIV